MQTQGNHQMIENNCVCPLTKDDFIAVVCHHFWNGKNRSKLRKPDFQLFLALLLLPLSMPEEEVTQRKRLFAFHRASEETKQIMKDDVKSIKLFQNRKMRTKKNTREFYTRVDYSGALVGSG
jgi:hypothetical protein